MPTAKQKTEEFYKNLGFLFYAMANADKKITQNEINSFRENIKTLWSPKSKEKEVSEHNAVSQIKIAFDKLMEEGKGAEECFEEFKDFYRAHPSFFDSEIKKSIWITADNIASSHAHKNKSELVLLNKLRLLIS